MSAAQENSFCYSLLRHGKVVHTHCEHVLVTHVKQAENMTEKFVKCSRETFPFSWNERKCQFGWNNSFEIAATCSSAAALVRRSCQIWNLDQSFIPTFPQFFPWNKTLVSICGYIFVNRTQICVRNRETVVSFCGEDKSLQWVPTWFLQLCKPRPPREGKKPAEATESKSFTLRQIFTRINGFLTGHGWLQATRRLGGITKGSWRLQSRGSTRNRGSVKTVEPNVAEWGEVCNLSTSLWINSKRNYNVEKLFVVPTWKGLPLKTLVSWLCELLLFFGWSFCRFAGWVFRVSFASQL